MIHRVLILFSLMVVPGCQKATERGADRAILQIDGEAYSRADFLDSLLVAHGDSYVRRFVDLVLVEREARRAGVKVSDIEVNAAVEEEIKRLIEKNHRGRAEAFDTKLERYGLDRTSWSRSQKQIQRVRLLVERLLRRVADPSLVKELFEARFGKDGIRRTIRQLVLSKDVSRSRLYTRKQYDKEKDGLKTQTVKLMRQLHGQLKAGADLTRLAREYSDGRFANEGGLLGAQWSGLYGSVFDETVKSLGVGETSKVFESDRGYHFIRIAGFRRGARYAGRYILCSAAPSSRSDARPEGERFRDALARAHSALEKIRDGAPFEAVARSHSDDAKTRSKGGGLGFFGPGRLGKRVDPVLEIIPLNSPSQPVRVSDGYVVVELTAREFRPNDDKKMVRQVFRATDYMSVKRRKLASVLGERVESKAEALLAELKGGADFALVAKRESEDPKSAVGGGRVPNFRSGMLGAEVDAALKEMKSGEFRIVSSKEALRIILLEKKRITGLESQRTALEGEILKRPIKIEDVQGYLENLRQRARVESYL